MARLSSFTLSLVLAALAALVLMAGLVLAAHAAEAPARIVALPHAAAPATAAPSLAERERAERLALNAALAQVLDAGHTTIAALEARVKAAPDAATRSALLVQISAAKQEQWLQVLRTQQQFAQAAGRTQQALELGAAIEGIVHPAVAPPATFVRRPAPAVVEAK